MVLLGWTALQESPSLEGVDQWNQSFALIVLLVLEESLDDRDQREHPDFLDHQAWVEMDRLLQVLLDHQGRVDHLVKTVRLVCLEILEHPESLLPVEIYSDHQDHLAFPVQWAHLEHQESRALLRLVYLDHLAILDYLVSRDSRVLQALQVLQELLVLLECVITAHLPD